MREGKLAMLEEDTVASMLERVVERFGAAGLARYEVSSFARAGHESRHNRRYWERRPVLGIGPGAWSNEASRADAPFGARRANARGLDVWQARVEAGQAGAVDAAEILDAATARGEAIFLALRTARGLDAAAFAAEFGAPPRAFHRDAIANSLRRGCSSKTRPGAATCAFPRAASCSRTPSSCTSCEPCEVAGPGLVG